MSDEIDYRREWKRLELERVALVARVAELEDEMELLAAEVKDGLALDDRIEELERVLGMVEFVPWGAEDECLWCEVWRNHAPDCPRQAALGMEEA